MKGVPLRAGPRNTVPRQARSLPGGRGANNTKAAELMEPRMRDENSVSEEASASKPKRRLAPPVPVAVARAPFVVLVIMAVIAGVLGILVLNTEINENAFALDGLRKEQVALDLREQHLKQLISEHESPGSLAAAAAKLGLVESGPPAFILLPDGKIIGVPKPATGTPSVTSQ